MQDLNITLIQTILHWENPRANHKHLAKIIQGIDTPTDLIVLPEMFSTGFSMSPAPIAEPMDGITFHWMQEIAKKSNASLIGSIIIKEKDNYYNRLLVVHPNGSYDKYDKRHLFTFAGENKAFTAGAERLIFNLKAWKICPMVCYDLRFPAWARNHYNEQNGDVDYDLLLYVANWPKPRINAWDTLLSARAIENQSYVAGLNRIGKDANENEYNGHSAVYDYLGDRVAGLDKSDGFISVNLSREKLNEFRKSLPFLKDGDGISLTLNSKISRVD